MTSLFSTQKLSSLWARERTNINIVHFMNFTNTQSIEWITLIIITYKYIHILHLSIEGRMRSIQHTKYKIIWKLDRLKLTELFNGSIIGVYWQNLSHINHTLSHNTRHRASSRRHVIGYIQGTLRYVNYTDLNTRHWITQKLVDFTFEIDCHSLSHRLVPQHSAILVSALVIHSHFPPSGPSMRTVSKSSLLNAQNVSWSSPPALALEMIPPLHLPLQ